MFLCWTWSATAVCPRVQTDRLFPTASFALSALSPYVSAGPWQWTAYLARTNHIWLLSVTVNYTPHGSCPDAAMQWKRSPHSAATRIFWRWARSQLASTTAFIQSVICHFMSIKKIGSAHLMLTIIQLTGRSVSFELKGEKKTSQDVQGILFNVQSPLKKIIQNHHHHWCDGDRKKCCHTELNANPHRFSPLRSWMDPSFVSDHIDGELNTN